jgi:hypothetical protein
MVKNNFFMTMVLGITALLGTSFELRSSEKSDLVPYVIGGSVIILGAGLLAGTKTATYQTYSKHKSRLAEEKDKADNSLLYAEALPSKRSSAEMPIINDRAQVYLNNYEKQRNAEAQKYATKITKEPTLASHIVDDYAGEYRK